MYAAPRYLACGDSALSVEFGQAIDVEINSKVLNLDRRVMQQGIEGIVETVPTYRSLLIHYDPLRLDFETLRDSLEPLVLETLSHFETNRLWTIPVVYGGDFGIDLADLARMHSLSQAAFVERHAAAEYRICMIGFMPGFAYLAGLDPRLQTPRRKAPRPNAPPGTISIGGAQTAVQSVVGPSGWHWIGRTPLRVYDPQRNPMCLLEPGDRVRFRPINPSQWDDESRVCDDMIAEAA